MSSRNCKWTPVAVSAIPAVFVSEGKLVTGAMTRVEDFSAGPLPEGELTAAVNAVVLDIVGQGEDASDATAIVSGAAFYVGESGGKYYAFFDTASGVFVYVEKCGAMANLTWIAGGALLAGLGGFAYGYSKRGNPAYGLMGATVGILAGGLAGYGVARLATPAYMKTGSLSVTRSAKRGRR